MINFTVTFGNINFGTWALHRRDETVAPRHNLGHAGVKPKKADTPTKHNEE